VQRHGVSCGSRTICVNRVQKMTSYKIHMNLFSACQLVATCSIQFFMTYIAVALEL
jgi:hypothetical protein